jgi:hypothetical protein
VHMGLRVGEEELAEEKRTLGRYLASDHYGAASRRKYVA